MTWDNLGAVTTARARERESSGRFGVRLFDDFENSSTVSYGNREEHNKQVRAGKKNVTTF